MGAAKFPAGADLQSKQIINLADPSSATDAATKQYVDNALAGLAWKQPVRVASTANGTLATAFANGQTLDGVSLTTGMRILLKDQSTGAENGIYTVNASGAPTRATDADSTAELQNATVYVIAGTVNADKAFTQTANDPTPGTTALVFAQVGGGTTYTAGNGLTLSSGTFAVVPGSGILADGSSTRIDPAYTGLAKRYSADCVATTNPQTFTHNLGTADVDVTARNKSTGEIIYPQATATDANNVSIDFGSAPTLAQWRVTVQG